MQRTTTVLGYAAAALTLAAMAALPFVLMPALASGVAATGVRIDPVYGGGAPRVTIPRGAYSITVHHPVRSPAPLTRVDPYVQLAWAPARALPPRVVDEVDIDGDGRPDLRARFDAPADSGAALLVDVDALTAGLQPLRRVSRGSFSALITRVGDAIVVRVPLRAAPRRAAIHQEVHRE